jgi:penicillin-binding protein 2
VDLITKYAAKYGLGNYYGVDLPQEKKGFLPTAAWKEESMHEMWYDGDSINYGIGQGFVQVTPLQMAAVYSAIGTGKINKPYIVKEIKQSEDKPVYQGKPEIIGDVPLSPDNLRIVREALREVVERGTGVATRINGLPAAGKTGTAENPGLAHAWFMCYAPFDDPEIVIGVFIAQGEHGDRASAYVARDILNWYKANRFTKKYPDEPPFKQYILHGKIATPYYGSRRRAVAQPVNESE